MYLVVKPRLGQLYEYRNKVGIIPWNRWMHESHISVKALTHPCKFARHSSDYVSSCIPSGHHFSYIVLMVPRAQADAESGGAPHNTVDLLSCCSIAHGRDVLIQWGLASKPHKRAVRMFVGDWQTKRVAGMSQL